MGQRTKIVAALSAVVAVVLLTLILFPEPIEEGRCKLVRKKADPDSQPIGLAFQFVRPLDDTPDNVQDVPAGFEQPRYYQINSGGRSILMVADFSQKQVRLSIDMDGDGILSEERCFTARVSDETPVSGRRQQLGPIRLVSRDGVTQTDGAFYVNCFRDDARGLLVPYPAYFRTGKLRLAGQSYRVAVVDGDHDGVFNSTLSLPLDRPWRLPACDVFAIDLNRNGAFEMSPYERSEVMPLGRLARVAYEYYAIEIAPDGRSLVLAKTEPQFGSLVLESNDVDAELRLWSDAADQHLSLGRQWQLPAGEYKGTHAILAMVDASGDVWTLSSNSSSAFTRLGALEHFTIQPDQTTSIRIGPPFVVKADIQPAGSERVSISPVLVGCGGEEYTAVCQQGRQRPSPIAFKIVDEEGTVLVTDRFQYG
jgi:hypothetical protein